MGTLMLSGDSGQHLHVADQPEFVEVPPYDFLVVEGTGGQRSAAFSAAADALFAVSFPVALAVGPPAGIEDRVAPLEAQWCCERDPLAFDPAGGDRSAWRWTLMVRQPDGVPEEVWVDAMASAARRLSEERIEALTLKRIEEGPCVQLLHRGATDQEGPTLARLHQFVADSGFRLRGRHHEIYLADPRRCPPARMRTLIRHPVC